MRHLVDAARGIVDQAMSGRTGDVDEFLDHAEHAVLEVSECRRTALGMAELSSLLSPAIERIQELQARKSPITGVPTGFYDLDRMTSGFQPSDLIVIAGRPSMGKSALAMNIGQHAAHCSGRPVAMFSLEMSKESLVLRMLCSEGRVDGSGLRSGRLARGELPRLALAAARLAEIPFFIDDAADLSVLELRSRARRLMHERGPLAMIVVDYLQLMRGHGKTETREQEISLISRSLKALAKELETPVVALSQLNRAVESRADKRPMISDLRESGAIEQDADVIAFVYRDEFYNKASSDEGVAEIIVAKQRNGPTGTVRLAFRKELTRFENLGAEDDAVPDAGGEPVA